jgi:hypothetical protein
MALDIKFRTNNPPLWSAYSGNRLPNTIADQNMYNIKVAIEELQTDRPSPDEISAITTFGLSWVVSFDSGREITVPVQVLQWRWRGIWQAGAPYQAFDGFMVEGVGLFSVNIDHTAALSFDPDRQIGGEPVYNAIYRDGTAANSAVIYDVGFSYGPKLADNFGDKLWEFTSVRAYKIPITGHVARLDIAPSTQDQTIPLFYGATQIGTITFEIGETQGDILISSETNVAYNEVFSVGKPVDADATAAGLSVTFALIRVV